MLFAFIHSFIKYLLTVMLDQELWEAETEPWRKYTKMPAVEFISWSVCQGFNVSPNPICGKFVINAVVLTSGTLGYRQSWTAFVQEWMDPWLPERVSRLWSSSLDCCSLSPHEALWHAMMREKAHHTHTTLHTRVNTTHRHTHHTTHTQAHTYTPPDVEQTSVTPLGFSTSAA